MRLNYKDKLRFLLLLAILWSLLQLIVVFKNW